MTLTRSRTPRTLEPPGVRPRRGARRPDRAHAHRRPSRRWQVLRVLLAEWRAAGNNSTDGYCARVRRRRPRPAARPVPARAIARHSLRQQFCASRLCAPAGSGNAVGRRAAAARTTAVTAARRTPIPTPRPARPSRPCASEAPAAPARILRSCSGALSALSGEGAHTARALAGVVAAGHRLWPSVLCDCAPHRVTRADQARPMRLACREQMPSRCGSFVVLLAGVIGSTAQSVDCSCHGSDWESKWCSDICCSALVPSCAFCRVVAWAGWSLSGPRGATRTVQRG